MKSDSLFSIDTPPSQGWVRSSAVPSCLFGSRYYQTTHPEASWFQNWSHWSASADHLSSSSPPRIWSWIEPSFRATDRDLGCALSSSGRAGRQSSCRACWWGSRTQCWLLCGLWWSQLESPSSECGHSPSAARSLATRISLTDQVPRYMSVARWVLPHLGIACGSTPDSLAPQSAIQRP